MNTDCQGNAVTSASPEAVALYDRAADAFLRYSGDPFALLDEAIEREPAFAMAHILRAYLFAVSTEPAGVRQVQKSIAILNRLPLNHREAAHSHALSLLGAGNWCAAATALDYLCAEFPHDLVALQCGHLVDFYRANARDLRDRIARALPQWSAEIPGYSYLLGMYAFGLEECGDYARAEEFGHGAIELEPFDCWAHHAVAHVLEMQDRADEGIHWMTEREPFWASNDNFFRVHNWWHCALYFLDRGDNERALALYDDAIRSERSNIALDLVDASALLWRLALLDCDIGERWHELAIAWRQHANGRTYPFNDWHAVMALLGAGHDADVETICNTIRATRNNEEETSHWAWHTGLPLIEGFVYFRRGDYQRCIEHLHPARYIANTFGGSHAQRDIIDWTLAEAALRAGKHQLAEALASERLALKAHSKVNQRLLQRATGLTPDH